MPPTGHVEYGIHSRSTINNLRYVHMQCRDDFYTSICNYLDYTASVFPVTLVDKARDRPAPPHAFRNHEDEAVYKMCACLHLHLSLGRSPESRPPG